MIDFIVHHILLRLQLTCPQGFGMSGKNAGRRHLNELEL